LQKKFIFLLFIIMNFFSYSENIDDSINSFKDYLILFTKPNFELVYYEKRPYGVHEFYSEYKDKYGKNIEQEGIYLYFKYKNNVEEILKSETIIKEYEEITLENNGIIHYCDYNSIVLEINNLWININVSDTTYEILAIKVVDIKNDFYTSQEIKTELFTNGKVVLKLIEFHENHLKLDSVNQLFELVKCLTEFESLNIKMCYYDYDSIVSVKEKSEIIKKYLTTFGIKDEMISIIQKDNIYKINGLVLFY